MRNSLLVIAIHMAMGLAVVSDKMPVFHARVEAPRLTREHAQLINRTEIIFEWHEARLQQHLWKAATRSISSESNGKSSHHQLRKRAPNPPGPRPVGAPLGRGNCAGCAALGNNLDEDILSWDWEYMQTLMITARRNRLNNRCVFYTGLPDHEKDAIEAITGERPEAQSDRATRYACSASLYSIWNLWPGKNENDDKSKTESAKRNYWEITNQGSWLYRLSPMNTGQFDGYDYRHYRGHYFSQMSNAMAHSCRGTVYVMAMNTDMSGYRGIWHDTEYPTLKSANALPVGSVGRVNRLILVKTLDPATEQYEMIFDAALRYPRAGSRIPRRDPDYLHFDLSDQLDQAAAANMTEEESAAVRHRLMKRDSCTANIEYERSERGDWFGRGY